MTFASYEALEALEALEAYDLTLLRAVFYEVCADGSRCLQQPEAEQIAHNLVQWFLFGVKTTSELKTMLKPW